MASHSTARPLRCTSRTTLPCAPHTTPLRHRHRRPSARHRRCSHRTNARAHARRPTAAPSCCAARELRPARSLAAWLDSTQPVKAAAVVACHICACIRASADGLRAQRAHHVRLATMRARERPACAVHAHHARPRRGVRDEKQSILQHTHNI
ncbi:hypothetical protein FA09DRAFT_44252 [Tilletiopsis washingtonensis]|uniref:Uncharacterized protein n=1 Tax=Tilletiopsis washingtonensis TaxID=58919 RepID=A0A316ZBR2_9BASI|nr:hypothetical protein FA09DRAFT_44252 [Tilletiopsis washingtonensis]PWN97705.1 hypothetical protein FA09DRAFT_44252 [Tilletiopsis washingtonensis]